MKVMANNVSLFLTIILHQDLFRMDLLTNFLKKSSRLNNLVKEII